MITQFGKFCRKLRIDNGELLKDMADKLGVTASYLSAVENGKRNVPREWAEKIVDLYYFDNEERNELLEAIELSQKEVVIEVESLNTNDKKFLAAFAREFKGLDEDEKIQIKNIFTNRKKG